MNPIFAREWRARWRDKRSYWLLFALVALLALAATWVYNGVSVTSVETYTQVYNPATGYYDLVPSYSGPLERAARTGRLLFQSLATGNCFVCLFLAPALAATGVARERERGLIESLQLSHMRPWSQIVARYFSAITYLLALQLAMVPVYCVVLMLGGVSPGELSIAAVLIGLTLLVGAALGIWFSARSYRPSNALFNVIGTLTVWTIFSFFLGLDANNLLFTTARWRIALFWTAAAHPVVLLRYLTQPENSLGYRATPVSVAFVTEGAAATFQALLWISLFLVPVLLWSAARKVNRPLPDVQWQGRNRWIVKWKQRLERQREELKQRTERAQLSNQVQGALVADLPLDKLANFRNPLLAREVRGRFRLRKGSIFVSLLRVAAFFAGILIYVVTLSVLSDPVSRARGWLPLQLIWLIWGLGMGAVGILAASSFAREKESGTWEGLRLAQLRPGEIVRAKWASILISFAYYSVPVWILVPVAVVWGHLETLSVVSLGVAVAIASLATMCAFGLWVSWRSPHPTAALAWTIGGAFAFFVVLPQLGSLVGLDRQVIGSRITSGPPLSASTSYNNSGYRYDEKEYSQGQKLWMWMNVWQPQQALSLLQSPSAGDYYSTTSSSNAKEEMKFIIPLAHVVVMLAGCAVFLALVRREVARERE